MSDVFSDEYWQNEFAVTQADMERLSSYISREGHAHHLKTLVSRIIAGRLRHGHDYSDLAQQVATERIQFAWWDEVREVQIGDQIFFLRAEGKSRIAYVGRVTRVTPKEFYVWVAEKNKEIGYEHLYAENPYRKRILSTYRQERENGRKLMLERRIQESNALLIETIFQVHGALIGQKVENALQISTNFVTLNEQWFLHRLVQKPTPEQIEEVAWHLLVAAAPPTTADLLTKLPLPQNDPTLFGLYVALRDHPNLFQMLNPGPEPAWQLVGPPPGPFTPRFPAYDPDTYTILCRPTVLADATIVSRLWETGLLQVVERDVAKANIEESGNISAA